MIRIYSLSLGFILTLVLAACAGATEMSQPVDPERLIPEQANFIAKVKMGEIFRDLDLWSFYEQAPKSSDAPQSFEDLLDLALGETGVDLREFESAILFWDVSRNDEFFGALARGRFEQSTLLAALENSGELTLVSQTYKGKEIHVGDRDDRTLALGFLSAEVLLIGTLPAVQAVIDVRVGDRPPASGQVIDSFEALGDPLFRMALVMQPEALAKLKDEIGNGSQILSISAGAVQDLDVVTLLVDRPGTDLKIEVQLSFTNPDSAVKIGKTLYGFLALGKVFPPNEQTRELLERLNIVVEAANVNIQCQAPLADLEEVASRSGNDPNSSAGN